MLKTTWQHPKGGSIRVDAVLIDSSDGDHQPHVYALTRPRFNLLSAGSSMRFSADLEPRYFEELVSERRAVADRRGPGSPSGGTESPAAPATTVRAVIRSAWLER